MNFVEYFVSKAFSVKKNLAQLVIVFQNFKNDHPG